jgi:hypothetical protein
VPHLPLRATAGASSQPSRDGVPETREHRRREDAKRFIEEVRGDDPDLASYLRIEERELEAGGLN